MMTTGRRRLRSGLLLTLLAGLLFAWFVHLHTDDPPMSASSGTAVTERSQPAEPAAPHVDPPGVEIGVASLHGRVVDDRGGPIAAAQVCALRQPPALPVPRLICTKTDEGGRYRLQVEAGSWRVGAGARDWAPSVAGPGRVGGVVGLRAGDEREIDLSLVDAGRRVQGVVVDALGGGVEGAWVTLGSHPSLPQPGATARSGVEGRFELFVGPGIGMLTAYADGYSPGVADIMGDDRDMEIVLIAETMVRGRVVWAPTGEPLPHVQVSTARAGASTYADARGQFMLPMSPAGGDRLLARGPGVFGALELSAGRPGQLREVVLPVDAGADLEVTLTVAGRRCDDGYVSVMASGVREQVRVFADPAELVGLPPGPLTLESGCRGAALDTRQLQLAADERATLRIDLETTGILGGTVVDPDGQPAARVWVHARGPVALSMLTGAAGDFSFDVLPPGRYQVEAQAKHLGAGAGPSTVALGQTSVVLPLRLQPWATVAGTLKTTAGEPASGVFMSIVEAETGRGVGFTSTDGQGRFSFPAIGPGRHGVFAGGLRLAPAGEAPTREQIELASVDVDAKALLLVVEARERTIEVEVVDQDGEPVTGVEVYAVREGELLDLEIGRRVTDADGQVRFEQVPAGQVVVEVLGARRRIDAAQVEIKLDLGA